jgi:hypothetical protein
MPLRWSDGGLAPKTVVSSQGLFYCFLHTHDGLAVWCVRQCQAAELIGLHVFEAPKVRVQLNSGGPDLQRAVSLLRNWSGHVRQGVHGLVPLLARASYGHSGLTSSPHSSCWQPLLLHHSFCAFTRERHVPRTTIATMPRNKRPSKTGLEV